MTTIVLKSGKEPTVEERIGRLEASVEHLRADNQTLRRDMQQGFQRIGSTIEASNRRIDDKFDSLKDSVACMALTLEKAKVWALLICGGLLAVIARAFGWL